jgi:hypothetical protein
MAKNNGSTKLVSPLYESGRMNGPVAGPTGGPSVPDPMSYLSKSGMKAPGGSPSDRSSGPAGERATAH